MPILAMHSLPDTPPTAYRRDYRRWLVVVALLWLLLLMRTIPASWALAAIGQPIRLDSTAGTIWQGSVEGLMLPFRNGYLALGRVDWQVLPAISLRHGALCAAVTQRLGPQRLAGQVCSRGSRHWTLHNLSLELPAAATQAPGGLRLGGELLFDVAQTQVRAGRLDSLQGSGSWQNAAVHNGQRWLVLGILGLQASALPADSPTPGTGNRVALDVFDITGPGSVDLRLIVATDGNFNLAGDVVLHESASEALRRTLALVAAARQGNSYRIDL